MTVRELIERLNTLPRWDMEFGGCGDPECCGTYIHPHNSPTGEYVHWDDLETILKEAQKEMQTKGLTCERGHGIYCPYCCMGSSPSEDSGR